MLFGLFSYRFPPAPVVIAIREHRRELVRSPGVVIRGAVPKNSAEISKQSRYTVCVREFSPMYFRKQKHNFSIESRRIVSYMCVFKYFFHRILTSKSGCFFGSFSLVPVVIMAYGTVFRRSQQSKGKWK